MTIEYTVKYPINSIVYLVSKANKGILKRIAIKNFEVIIDKSTCGQPLIVYTDTTNFLWNEWDLCAKSVAVTLATAYYNYVLEEIDEL